MSWVAISDRIPTKFKGSKKFRVKAIVGSASPSVKEFTALAKFYVTGFRFSVGDWTTVTHWWEETN